MIVLKEASDSTSYVNWLRGSKGYLIGRNTVESVLYRFLGILIVSLEGFIRRAILENIIDELSILWGG